MHIIYDDVSVSKSGRPSVPFEEWDAVGAYLRHYDNYLYLDFIVHNTDDWREKRQALKEIGICERKLKYWERHPNYDLQKVLNGVAELKKKWRNKSE